MNIARKRPNYSTSFDRSGVFLLDEFYSVFRDEVSPYLRTYPSLKIWYAECPSREEASRLAELLGSEGLPRFEIYATHHHRAHVVREQGRMSQWRNWDREKVFYFHHSLAMDGPFNVFQLILFNTTVKFPANKSHPRMVHLFLQSLHHFGFLGLTPRPVRLTKLLEKDFGISGAGWFKKLW